MRGRERKFDPIEAAYAVAQYFPADPAVWLERCALADITVFVAGGRQCELYVNGDERADHPQAAFLSSWLNLTPGGKAAVIALLDQRGQHGPPAPPPSGSAEA